ncbi:hypothetical protein MMC13_003244 [Lambiella insularis]|nr:hypothetical protein [Lambiella insularis]
MGALSRTVSGETLNSEDMGLHGQLVPDGIQALGLDWRADLTPGDGMKRSLASTIDLGRRRSTRLNIMKKGTNSCGKRGREAVEQGKEKPQASSRTASLRSRRMLEDKLVEGPSQKKVRTSEGTVIKGDSPATEPKCRPVVQSRSKRWLLQGLYVGQERDFDARLTESKNKLRRATFKRLCRQRSILPLPMFAGERTIDIGRDFRLPFDIFSPMPPGQPKPEEWRKTQKNVFVGDAAEFWKKSKRLEHSTCICESASGCDENCFNRFMFYECDNSNCNIGIEHCTNRSFEKLRQRCKMGGKYNVGVEVIKTIDRGYGVRSNRTFEPNQIIVEYTGEIITQDECDNRMRKMYKNNECFYLMVFDQNMIIDATRGSIARFVNHSCEPNCRMIKWTVAGKPRMALFAGERGIMTGEELTYDYNFDPFSSKSIQECRCGASACRGVLGPKPKDQGSGKPKDIKEALKPLLSTGMKRKFQQLVEESLELVMSKKRRIIRPSSMRSRITSLKGRASTQLNEAKALVSTDAQQEKMVKKAPTRSLHSVPRRKTSLRNGKMTTRHQAVR